MTSEEKGMLAAIREGGAGAELARMAYADWLEERGNHARAVMVRRKWPDNVPMPLRRVIPGLSEVARECVAGLHAQFHNGVHRPNSPAILVEDGFATKAWLRAAQWDKHGKWLWETGMLVWAGLPDRPRHLRGGLSSAWESRYVPAGAWKNLRGVDGRDNGQDVKMYAGMNSFPEAEEDMSRAILEWLSE